MIKVAVFILSFFVISYSNAQHQVVLQEAHRYIDQDKKLIICNQSTLVLNTLYGGEKNAIFIDEAYQFETAIEDFEIGKAYQLIQESTGTTYLLYFSELPLISIVVQDSIVNEPDVAAYFTMIEPNGTLTQSHMGIQYRGYSSQNYPKKSMALSFWQDASGTEKRNITLLGLINDDDWNLQAMYNEPIRSRSKSGYDLWRSINTLHYQHLEPLAINGVRMEYVEVFINGDYRGVYCVGEKPKRKQFRLRAHNGTIRGELYKAFAPGANDFSDCPPFFNSLNTWGGFEYKYPKAETNWQNLHDFVNFVVHSDSTTFYDNYHEHFEIDNAVDYFIFLNLLRLTDNITKNNFIAKYHTHSKYFYIPWDLDGSFGINWNMLPDLETEDLLTNGFFNRLILDCSPNGFRDKLTNKWHELRTDVLTAENIMELFYENHDFLELNGVYEREMLAWNEYAYDSLHLQKIQDWLENRLTFLDGQFTEHCKPLGTAVFSNFSKVIVYPNPAQDILYIQHDLFDLIEKLELYDMRGQLAIRKTDNCNVLNISGLNSGTYLLQIYFRTRMTYETILISVQPTK